MKTTMMALAILSSSAAYLPACTGGDNATALDERDAIGSVEQPLPSGGITFSGPTYYSENIGPTGPAIGDLNGDGKLDVVIAHDGSGNAGSAGVRLGNGNGTLQAEVTTGGAGNSSQGAKLGDFNADGKLDVALVNGAWNSGSVSIFLGNGDGTLLSAVTKSTAGYGSEALALGDLNGDGKLDAATADSEGDSVSILLGNGDGSVQSAVGYSVGDSPHSVATADLNGDGKLDIVAVNKKGNSVSVLKGNGDGTFQASTSTFTGSNTFPLGLAAADIDADGDLDVVTASSYWGNLIFLRGNGDGTFQAAVQMSTGSSYPMGVVSADFDTDGKVDVAVHGYGSNDVRIMKGNGDGTFQSSAVLYAASTPIENAIVAGDLDADGRVDIVTTARNNFFTQVLRNTTPICSDGLKNGNETGIDCGGSCSACPTGISIPTGTFTTEVRGGTGGTAFDDACPSGQVLIGFDASSYDNGTTTSLSQLVGRCGTVSLSAASPASAAHPYDVFVTQASMTSPAEGSLNNGPTPSAMCPVNEIVIGFTGTTFTGANGDLMGKLGLICAPLEVTLSQGTYSVSLGSASETGNLLNPNGSGSEFPDTLCGPAQVARKLMGRSGNRVNALKLRCSTPALAY